MRKDVLLLIFVFVCSILSATTVVSTSAGGNWTAGTTWQGGVAPGPGDNVGIIGPVVVNSYPACHNLYVEPSGSLSNPEGSITTIYVSGDLTNSGTIQDNVSSGILSMRCYGNLINYGTYTASVIFFLGTLPQQLANSGIFTPDTIYDQVIDSSLTLLTSLNLTNTALDLGGSTLILNGIDLTLNGGYLKSTSIQGGNATTLTLGGGAYLNGVSADNIILDGTVLLRGNITFGQLDNFATLYNYPAQAEAMTVTNRLNNLGTIKDNPDNPYLAVYLAGDLYNFGEIKNRSLTFQGSAVHSIYQDEAALPLNCQYFTVQASSGNVQLLSDLAFLNCLAEFNLRTLLLHCGRASFSLCLNGGYLKSATLATQGFSTLTLGGGAYLNNVAGGDFILQGTVEVAPSSYLTFDGLVNNGTLQNYSTGSYRMTCTGDLVNNGTIRDNPVSGSLALYCGGDIDNYGSILNNRVFVNGTADQYILVAQGSTVSCAYGFILMSNLTGSVQWYFNDAYVYGYNTEINLNGYGLNPGIWQPRSGAIYGRNIILGTGGAVSVPQNLILVESGSELKLQWDEVPNAVYYVIYAASDPYGAYLPLADTAYDNDPSDGIVWWELTPAESRQFFKVAAGN